MLKIVPDPPLHPNQSIEDILVQASEYLVCAMTVAQQTVLLHSNSSCQVLTLACVHEIDYARNLVEAALSRVQIQH